MEAAFENERLEQTLALARAHLEQAKLDMEGNKSAIISAKQDMRDNASHSISNLYNSQNFDDLVELSQFTTEISNKVADYETTANKIAVLERLIQAPYFARIDFEFDDEEQLEKIYIGRSSLMKDDSYEMFIYDWRSPIASVFYRFGTGQAFYEAPNGRITGEVHLKRQYEIKKGILDYFFDADVQITDEFLRKLLSQNTSPKMKTIVETIQKEQDIVIRDMENDVMMVQGVAGSGKTSIALHRAAYLMYQGLSSKLSANNIIIISPNTVFEQYISHVLPELGENNVVSYVFEELLAAVLHKGYIQSRNQFLERMLTSKKQRNRLKNSIQFKTSRQFLEIINRFIEDLPHRWIKFEDVYYKGKCIVSKEVIKDRVLTGRKETPLGLKLKQVEGYILEAVREARGNRNNQVEDDILKKEIQKFTELDVEDLYRKLIGNPEYFYGLAKDLELPDCISDILRFTRKNLFSDILYYDDAVVLAFFKLKVNRSNKYKHIKQVVIDEAQDYYPLHYEILSALFSNAKYTILGDINQTLEKQEDLSLYEQIGAILKKKSSILVTMDKSFRCTNEILTYSSKFLPQPGEIKSFSRKGEEPAIYTAADRMVLHDQIISEIMACSEKGYQSIGLICKTERNAISLFDALKDRIELQLIKNDSNADLQGIFIIPVYMAKGLEFDAVLICDAERINYHSEEDKKLLYIGCTRALHRLSLFCMGEVNPLL